MPELAENDKDIPVRVAVRCRPLITKELSEGCQTCLTFVPNEPQLVLGKDKAFTYDYVFDSKTQQSVVYEKAVEPLVEGIFKGYNATVLAYGQTGSGKTYTMGSGYTEAQAENEGLVGVIPRVINNLFKEIGENEESTFTLKVSYLEVYNEEIFDLLSKSKKENLAIREDTDGSIRVQGLEEVEVKNGADMVKCLEQGSDGRTTGNTAMNSQSSRSHAIFTIHIEQRKNDDSNDFLQAKFHLVDLAGSERAKKTMAQGDRFKEGVNINRGLLALGNVISALGDENGRKGHVPYRDAKLTRLLQDSLGGNSQTLMIACVSPADSNMEETLNTLRYADRARQIKNKPVVNRDPVQAELMRLRQQVQQLLVQGGSCTGSVNTGSNIQGDMKVLIERNKKLEAENQKLSAELQASVDQTTQMCEKAIMLEVARDKLKQKLDDIKGAMGPNMELLKSLENETDSEKLREQLKSIKDLQQKITQMEEEDTGTLSAEELNMEEEMESSGESGEGAPLDKEHLLRRAEMNRQLQELNKALQMKQELASQMTDNDGRMTAMKIQYETTMKQLESEISSLQKEKDDLAKALVEVKNNTVASKLSEQRRQRLRELESQIGQLKKKLADHGKLLKLKEQSDQRVTKLNNEIKAMKQTRVRLMKQMKEDSARFQQFKAKKDKEVMQLKEKDRKRQFELTKLTRKNELQQNMLKRKAEEATAANKRLKDALQKQKSASDKREESFVQSDMKGIGQRVRSWLGRELEVLVSMEEARHHLQSLLADRKVISQQLTELEGEKSNEPPKKKRALNDTFTCEDDEDDSVSETDPDRDQKIQNLKQELQMRSAQIADLQQRVMDADQEEKAKHRWSNIRTLVEAKCGLKWLLNTLVECKLQQSITEGEVKDMKSALADGKKDNDDLAKMMDQMKASLQEELTNMERDHESKVLYLLKELQTQGSESSKETDDSRVQKLKERMKFQESQIAELSSVHERLQDVLKENEDLKRQLTVANYQGRTFSLLPQLDEPPSVSEIRESKTTNKGNSNPKKKKELLQEIFESDYDDESFEDSDWSAEDTDSSWCETPIKRKRSQLLNRKKLSILKAGCGCKGKCSSKKCGCVKGGKKCEDSCKCKSSECINREGDDTITRASDEDDTIQSNDMSTESESQSENSMVTMEIDSSKESPCLNSTFVKSPDVEEENPVLPRKALKTVSKNTDKAEVKKKAASSDIFKKPSSALLVKRPRPDGNDISNQGLASKKKKKLLNSSDTSYFKPVV
ncbi:chromosome-associated kinesin KIF4-like [Ptychodera flava]|uniref:chromosome-associated kinesin KIF4-like n=1 Tax=Ptychodera flava TaxID=63121 RepID=UPI00396A395E